MNKKNLFRGFEAEDMYIVQQNVAKYHDDEFYDEIFAGKLPKDWFLFKKFKMGLYGKEGWIYCLFS